MKRLVVALCLCVSLFGCTTKEEQPWYLGLSLEEIRARIAEDITLSESLDFDYVQQLNWEWYEERSAGEQRNSTSYN